MRTEGMTSDVLDALAYGEWMGRVAPIAVALFLISVNCLAWYLFGPQYDIPAEGDDSE